MINTIDLFAGCGGLMDGFEQSGKYRTLACVEWETAPCLNIAKRLKDKWGYEDADKMDKLSLSYHQKIVKKELPFTIGGGIGQSRICMLILEKDHIAEVQQSSWQDKTEKDLEDYKVL